LPTCCPRDRCFSGMYVSDELAHFVGREADDDRARYELLVDRILRPGQLLHPPHDPSYSGNITINLDASISNNEMYVPQVVCFCDIPASI
jgi:hypothetical protein